MPILILQLALLIALFFLLGYFVARFVLGPGKAKELLLQENEQTIIAAALSHPLVDVEPVEKPSEAMSAAHQAQAVVPDEGSAIAVKTAAIQSNKKTVAVPAAEPVPSVSNIVESLQLMPDLPLVRVEIGRPKGLDAPLGGQADDFCKIKGIGPFLQSRLNTIGIFHYTQIARLNADEARWIDRFIDFPGRVERESWVDQAKTLISTPKYEIENTQFSLLESLNNDAQSGEEKRSLELHHKAKSAKKKSTAKTGKTRS